MCHAITHEQHAQSRLHSVPHKRLEQSIVYLHEHVSLHSLQDLLQLSLSGCFPDGGFSFCLISLAAVPEMGRFNIMGLSPRQCLLKAACCSTFSFYSCFFSSISWHWIVQYVVLSIACNFCIHTFFFSGTFTDWQSIYESYKLLWIEQNLFSHCFRNDIYLTIFKKYIYKAHL